VIGGRPTSAVIFYMERIKVLSQTLTRRKTILILMLGATYVNGFDRHMAASGTKKAKAT